jgi:Fe-S-cluster containining protein
MVDASPTRPAAAREATPSEPPLWPQWAAAAARPAVDEALRKLYAELDTAVAARGPTCWTSGRCCKFVEFDHRLYVTGLEIAWFLQQVELPKTPGEGQTVGADPPPSLPGVPGVRLPQWAEHAGACPYQIGGLCSTHAVRPLGCRIFFCQAGTEAWQQDLYEEFLAKLQRLHREEGLPYRYMDWIAGLTEAAEAARPAGR